MEHGVIEKCDLRKLIDAVTAGDVGGRVRMYAPAEGVAGIEFREVTEETEISFDYLNPKLSAKGIFFPQREVLCTFRDGVLEEVPLPVDTRVVFGVRPCGASSLKLLDKIFCGESDQSKDPYYLRRRENSLIIALACREPAATCFCTSVGGSPAGKEGVDVLAHELGDTLLLEACSEKGGAFMEAASGLLREPERSTLEEVTEQISTAEARIASLDLSDITEKLDGSFDEPDWDAITRTCLGCGICTYLCPTCHCFDITDEENGSENGCRLRTWDSCQYPLFTLHASGHNPRVNKKQRMRQRIMHKYSYTVANNGDVFCVGCGRCITYCPVNLDIREILGTFAEK